MSLPEWFDFLNVFNLVLSVINFGLAYLNHVSGNTKMSWMGIVISAACFAIGTSV